MSGGTKPSRPIRFGPFEADIATGELLKDGRPVRLQDQPFQVLRVLLAHPGELVTREQLREEIWGGDVYVDFDRSLNTAVARLREALGDSPTRPAYIETVPRRGYRLIAPLHGSEAGTTFSQIGESKSSATGAFPLSGTLRRGAALASVCLILLAAAFWYFDSTPPPQEPRTVPLTSYPGVERSPSFSPDGASVAFVWNGERQDNYDIYVKLIGVEPPLKLTSDPNKDYSPVWSPDGRSIAFVRDIASDKAAVYVVPALGGPERRIASIYAPPREAGSESVPSRHLDWSPDGEWITFADKSSPDDPFALYALSTVTGERKGLSSPPEGYRGDLFPAFSWNGRSIAFFRRGSPAFGDLYVLALSPDLAPQRGARRLTFDEAIAAAPAWTEDDSEIIFQSRRDGGTLWRIAADAGGSAERLASVGPNSLDPAVCSREDRLAYTRLGAKEMSIRRIEIDPGEGKSEAPVALVASTGLNINPDFSPDGSQIVFQSSRSGRGEIWMCDRDGSNVRQLTSGIGTGTGSPRWSPDGKRIAFDVRLEGKGDIYVIRLEGGALERMTEHQANDLVPNWSRDGQWLYFASDRSGEYQIWKMPGGGGEARQVTRRGGLFASESPDAKSLYFCKALAGAGLWKVPTAGGREVQVLDSVFAYSNFVVVDLGIYFIPTPAPLENPAVHFLSFNTKAIKPVASIPNSVHAGLAVSPERDSLLYSQVDYENSDLMLVENFR